MKAFICRFFYAVIFLAALQIEASPKVALMDFSTDDNSYRSAQKAADFTVLVQAKLSDGGTVEWIERSQLELAEKELSLTALSSDKSSAVRRGRWVKADWLVTGEFSQDDEARRILLLEVLDLHHADLLASRTVTLTNDNAFDVSEAGSVADDLRALLADAKKTMEKDGKKIVLAPLFFFENQPFGFRFNANDAVQQDFFDELQNVFTTNSTVRLARFPHVNRSLDEMQMVLSGMVEDDQNAWQKLADYYLWGNYGVTGPRDQRGTNKFWLNLTLWDGRIQPKTYQEEINYSGALPAREISQRLRKVIQEFTRQVQHSPSAIPPSDSIRHEIAESLLKNEHPNQNHPEVAMLGHSPGEMREFGQKLQLLEMACFFDPQNASAQAQRVSFRWGFWINFSSTFGFNGPKSEFWTKWRKSEAWGKYVDNFGLQTPSGLSFPYDQPDGVVEAYLLSLAEVLQMWKIGNHEWAYNFPKDLPPDAEKEWKEQMDAEYWKRLTKVVEFIKDGKWTPWPNKPSLVLSAVTRGIIDESRPPLERLALLEKIWPDCAAHAQKYGKEWILGTGQLASQEELLLVDLCAQAGEPEKAGQLLAMLPQPQSPTAANPAPDHPPGLMNHPPGWPKTVAPDSSQESPAPSLVALNPKLEKISFPETLGVMGIRQMDFDGQGKLWIAAEDNRSAGLKEVSPDLAGELSVRSSKLWTYDPGTQKFEPRTEAGRVNAFLFHDQKLWTAGNGVNCLDPRKATLKHFALPDGLPLQDAIAIAFAGGQIFAAGDFMKVYSTQLPSPVWTNLPPPNGGLEMLNGHLGLAGCDRWLLFEARYIYLYDTSLGTWTNLPGMEGIAVGDESGFWVGEYRGNESNLHFIDPKTMQVRDYTGPEHRYYANITALASDKDYLWVACADNSVLIFHKPTRSWIGSFKVSFEVSRGITAFAFSEQSAWLGGYGSFFRIEKNNIYSTPNPH
jgi:hypothetical protein